jgi:hypothetical protein
MNNPERPHGADLKHSKRLPQTVIVLGFVSFFNDFASDIVIPLIPILLATVLAATTKCMEPIASHLANETADAASVARDGMIIQPATHNGSQPSGRFAKWPVHSLSQLSSRHNMVSFFRYTLCSLFLFSFD